MNNYPKMYENACKADCASQWQYWAKNGDDKMAANIIHQNLGYSMADALIIAESYREPGTTTTDKGEDIILHQSYQDGVLRRIVQRADGTFAMTTEVVFKNLSELIQELL
jgi:hypothetical protein